MEALLVAGIGVGLSSIAGIRAYLPLALVGLFAALGLFVLPEPLGILGSWVVVGALFVLALLETVLDKVSALDPVLDYVQTPVRIVSGAVLFSAVLGAGVGVSALPELAIGAAIAGVVAVSKIVLRPSAKAASASAAGVSTYFLSLFEDAVALVGGALAVFVPLVPLVLVAFLLFFFFRVRRRRGRKYGGLRILRD
jgi:Domain of unknown function (DUF4126)